MQGEGWIAFGENDDGWIATAAATEATGIEKKHWAGLGVPSKRHKRIVLQPQPWQLTRL